MTENKNAEFYKIAEIMVPISFSKKSRSFFYK